MPDNLQPVVYFDIGHGKPLSLSSQDLSHGEEVFHLVPALQAGSSAFMTTFEDSPWLIVDLEHEMCVSRVRVLGTDHNFDHILPLYIESASEDGFFQPLLTHHVHFGGRNVDYPLTIDFPWGRYFRYLRISVPRSTRLFLDYIEISTRIPAFMTGRLIDIKLGTNGLRATYAHHQSYGFSWTFTLALIAILECHKRGVRIENLNFMRALNQFKDRSDIDPYALWFRPTAEHFSLEQMKTVPSYLHHIAYAELNLQELNQYAEAYFSPSQAIINYCALLQTKYGIDPLNTCVIFYRGTDKHVEVKPAEIDDYMAIATSLTKQSPMLKVLIQTDQSQIRDLVTERMTDVIAFSELPVTDEGIAVHNHDVESRFGLAKSELGFRLLAVTYFVSRCRYLITHTGNMGVWAAIYRGHTEGLYQACVDGRWRGPGGCQVDIDALTNKGGGAP